MRDRLHCQTFLDWLAEYTKANKQHSSEESNKVFSQLNWVLIEGLTNALHKMKANNRRTSVSDCNNALDLILIYQ